MNVLYVVGANLTRNTSANMSHNGYVQGLIENGCDVDVLMQTNSWGQKDTSLKQFKSARYFMYESESCITKLRKRFSHGRVANVTVDNSSLSDIAEDRSILDKLKGVSRAYLKKMFYYLFPEDPLYPLDKTWLKKARAFKGRGHYDLIVSNSSPSASHKMVEELLKNGKITCSRWVQIWEDPWYYDIYGCHGDAIKDEEHRLLTVGNEIYYVSPLTLHYQKKLFLDCAHKLKYIALPALKYEQEEAFVDAGKTTYGYFGDYYSVTRNLKPFYDALKESENHGFIYGDSDLGLQSTDRIGVCGRVTLDVLSKVQARTTVLVHLCNLRGGQIPGKIYHYSATNKPILFILDGTEEEIELIKNHFSQFDRYIFCENNSVSIVNAMNEMETIIKSRKFEALACFSPREVVKRILP